MNDREFDDFKNDQEIGDYEINGPDQITWSDLQSQEDDWESSDNRFAGLDSYGEDIFGRYGW